MLKRSTEGINKQPLVVQNSLTQSENNMSWAVSADKHTFPTGFVTLQPLKKMNQKNRKPIEIDETGMTALARRENLSLHTGSVLVTITKSTYPRTTELDPGTDS